MTAQKISDEEKRANKIKVIRARIADAQRLADKATEDRKKLSAAYDYLFSLIQKEQKKGEGHLHLMILEDCVNEGSKELIAKYDVALQRIANREQEIIQITEESKTPRS